MELLFVFFQLTYYFSFVLNSKLKENISVCEERGMRKWREFGKGMSHILQPQFQSHIYLSRFPSRIPGWQP